MTDWQEFEASQFTRELIQNHFIDKKFPLLEGKASLTFLDIDIDGDSSVVMKNEKPAPNFEYKLIFDYKASQKQPNGHAIVFAKGSMNVLLKKIKKCF